jgi:hypothetical protein
VKSQVPNSSHSAGSGSAGLAEMTVIYSCTKQGGVGHDVHDMAGLAPADVHVVVERDGVDAGQDADD